MATLEEATRPIDQALFEREPVSAATSLTPPPFVSPDTYYSIRSNVNLRSPSPPINVSPDNLRQYYRGGQAPQYRVLSPPTLSQQASNSVSAATTTVVSSGTITTSASGVTSPPLGQKVGFSTPALLVGQVYSTTIQIAKAFDVQGFGVNAPARIRLYKTAATQAADASRTLTQPVPLGTQNGLICDMQLQQPSEFSWNNSPDFPGSNGDNPQTTTVYLTITNIGSGTSIISLTIRYVPTES